MIAVTQTLSGIRAILTATKVETSGDQRFSHNPEPEERNHRKLMIKVHLQVPDDQSRERKYRKIGNNVDDFVAVIECALLTLSAQNNE